MCMFYKKMNCWFVLLKQHQFCSLVRAYLKEFLLLIEAIPIFLFIIIIAKLFVEDIDIYWIFFGQSE